MLYTRIAAFAVAVALVCSPLAAANAPNGFTGTDLIVPAAGQIQGADGSQFVTSVWVTNPTAATVSYQLQFLRAGQSNTNPATSSDTVGPGQTKVYDNVAQSVFGTYVRPAGRVSVSATSNAPNGPLPTFSKQQPPLHIRLLNRKAS